MSTKEKWLVRTWKKEDPLRGRRKINQSAGWVLSYQRTLQRSSSQKAGTGAETHFDGIRKVWVANKTRKLESRLNKSRRVKWSTEILDR